MVVSRLLLFSTFAPGDVVSDPCASSGGSGRVFAIDFLTAEPALSRILEVTDAAAAGKEIAKGLPTPARITYGARGAVLAIQAFSGGPGAGSGQFIIVELPAFPVRTQTLYWREIF